MPNRQEAPARVKVLFVCLGNICRSPLAHGVFRRLVAEAGLAHRFEIDSAGTGAWHVGEPPDGRMQRTAHRNGVSLADLRARQVAAEDLRAFDHILVMDRSNLNAVRSLDRRDQYGHKVRLFREYDPEPGDYQVPDPYYGGTRGFENVYAIVERAARTLLERLVDEHALVPERKTG